MESSFSEDLSGTLGWLKPRSAAEVVHLIGRPGGWDGSRLPINPKSDYYGATARLRLTVQGWGLAGRLQDFARDWVVSPVDPTRYDVPREVERVAVAVAQQANADYWARLMGGREADGAAPFRPRLALDSRLLPGGLAELISYGHRLDPFLGDWFEIFAPWIFTRRQAALAKPKGGAQRRWQALERARERELVPAVVRQFEAAELDAQTLVHSAATKYPSPPSEPTEPRLGAW